MRTSQKIRLDQLLVERHGYESRARARDAIKRGCVFSNGTQLAKPGQTIPSDLPIEIQDAASRYVSRAALKLIHALDHWSIDVTDRFALDLGASTGGFTQVLLERGAQHVIAVDVGSGQLHRELANHPQVTAIENLNVRHLGIEDLNGLVPDLITSDLSFISLKLALPPALVLAGKDAIGIFLIKPQFEVGKGGIGRGGIVRDDKLIQDTIDDLGRWLDDQPDWHLREIIPSPIEGGDGNREYLMLAHKVKTDG